MQINNKADIRALEIACETAIKETLKLNEHLEKDVIDSQSPEPELEATVKRNKELIPIYAKLANAAKQQLENMSVHEKAAS